MNVIRTRGRAARLAAAIAGLALAGATTGGAAAASAAATQSTSENWAGYVAAPRSAGTTYSSVSASWIEPAARSGTGTAYSAFWVGLGGSSSSSSALEQVGTETDWVGGRATYSAWYELVPKASVRLKLTIHAGDHIYGRVTVSGTTVTVALDDRTSGRSVTRTLYMSDPDTSSAEWIAEAPSTEAPDGSWVPLTLADFGTVTFSGASATTAAGHTGSISDPAWTTERITLSASGGAGGPVPGGRFDASTVSSTEGARPSPLRGDGTRFSVSWQSGVSSTF